MEYAPGTHFSEMDLAKELGTPRAKVREAFNLLAQDKLIQIIPQRRTTICKLELGNILDSIFIIRSILIAVVKDTLLQPLENEAIIRQLRENLSALETGSNHSELEFFKADHQFYLILSGLNGFKRLNKIIFKEKLNIDRILRLSTSKRQDYPIIAKLYGKVLDGIVSGDFEKPIKALCELASALEEHAHLAAKNHPELFK